MSTRRNFFKYLGLAGGVAGGGIVAAAAVLPDPENKKIVDKIKENKEGTLSFHTTYGEEVKERMRLSADHDLHLGTETSSQGLYVYQPNYVPGTTKQVVVDFKPGPDGELYL